MSENIFKSSIYLDILNKVDHGFIVIDEEWTVLLWNKWFSEVSSIKPENAIGKKLNEIFKLEKRLSLAIKRVLRENSSILLSQSFNPFPFPLYKSDGSPVYQRTSIQPINDRLKYCLINITDVTSSLERERFLKLEVKERKRAEFKLEESLKELKSTQSQLVQTAKLASMGEMSAGIGHELNNPLFFIMGFNNRIKSKFMKSQILTYDEVKEYIEDIDNNCMRIKKIIDHLRDFSRQAEYKKQVSKINQIIEKSFVLFNDRLNLKNIKVNLKLSKGDLYINCDPNRIEQVFFNLINNSIDAIESKKSASEGMIEVGCEPHQYGTKIYFKDNGLGISKANLAKIFDPFFTTKEVGKGTGLGLSISFGIIKEHGGTLECKSQEGEWTQFEIILPNIQEMKEAI